MIVWSRYKSPFGDGAALFRRGQLERVYLPEPHCKAPARVLAAYPDATEALLGEDSRVTAISGALESFFEGRGDGRGLRNDILWTQGTPFQVAVLKACFAIPRGEVLTYAALAEKAGYPGCARAAGTVMATNRLPLVIPCHRVVRSGGDIGNYGGGSDMKRWLLEREGALQSLLA